jgi:dTDP-4-dehydrorhamnose reductase
VSVHDSIVITGGGGMLGHALGRALAARGLHPVLLDRQSLDITREADIARLFQEHCPTLLLNCAAHTKVDLCEQQQELADSINGHAVGLLARQAKAHDTFLVHFSTDFVFDGRGSRPYRPDDPVAPLSAYGRSKLLGETLLQQNAPERWLIVRTAWLYGRNGLSFPRTMVERAKSGQPLRVVCDQIGSPTYTEDLAAGTLELIDSGARGLWHLTNAGTTSWLEFARATLAAFGIEAPVASTTAAEWFKLRPASARRPSYSVLEIEPFARQVGHPMRPWQDALTHFAASVGLHGFA